LKTRRTRRPWNDWWHICWQAATEI